jgi:hypothetical protein
MGMVVVIRSYFVLVNRLGELKLSIKVSDMGKATEQGYDYGVDGDHFGISLTV